MQTAHLRRVLQGAWLWMVPAAQVVRRAADTHQAHGAQAELMDCTLCGAACLCCLRNRPLGCCKGTEPSLVTACCSRWDSDAGQSSLLSRQGLQLSANRM